VGKGVVAVAVAPALLLPVLAVRVDSRLGVGVVAVRVVMELSVALAVWVDVVKYEFMGLHNESTSN
jgi:hypothetical protein